MPSDYTFARDVQEFTEKALLHPRDMVLKVAMLEKETAQGARRELKSRQQPWAQKLAKAVDQAGLTPNAISVLSVFFAIFAAACFILVGKSDDKITTTFLWFGAALGIQLRLICNLLDGMVAIEGGKKSVVGGLYNEVPDRIADPLIIAAAGYSSGFMIEIWHLPLGWIAAALSVFTAYIRVLGGTLGVTQSFIGPMAKQHRMALLTFASLASIAELWIRSAGNSDKIMLIALALMVFGCILTSVRRLRLISQELYKKSTKGI